MAALAAAVAIAPILAQASEEPKKVEKRIKVVVKDDGEEKVIEREIMGGEGGPQHFAFMGGAMGGGRLGVALADVKKDDVAVLKLQEERGAVVKSVDADSAAAKAGLKEGDVIVRFQGDAVWSAAALARMVRETPVGRTVSLEVTRGGAVQKISATLGEPKHHFEMFLPGGPDAPHAPMPPHPPLPPQSPQPPMGSVPHAMPLPPGHQRSEDRVFGWKSRDDDSDEPLVRILHSSGPPRLGVVLQDVDGQLARYFKLPAGKGVLVTSVEENSAAAKAGVKSGDVVQKLDGTAVATASELRSAVRKAEGGKPLTLSVWRDGKSVDLAVTLPPVEKTKHRAPSI
jgi:membrane-associated protease RseP (regulator of RpoE activity)